MGLPNLAKNKDHHMSTAVLQTTLAERPKEKIITNNCLIANVSSGVSRGQEMSNDI